MSHRAIRRLRQERDDILSPDNGDQEEDEESEDDEEDLPGRASKPGFAFMMDDDEEEEESDSENEEAAATKSHENEEAAGSSITAKVATQAAAVEEKKTAEDLDALLEEFKQQDEEVEVGPDGIDEKTSSYYDIITSNIELRGLDIDFVQRTSLLGSSEDSAPARARRGRQPVFGPPRDNWPRPPHYVGGGMGMVTYETANGAPAIPWPYSEMKAGDERCPEPRRWFLITYSDSYERDRDDFERIKASGDPNALALFVAHHPFVVEALLQLSTVLYQTNHSQEGLAMLKRSLYTYECASLNSFLQIEDRLGFMDNEQPSNQLFVSALFRLIRVSHVAG